ncbi:MAG: threonylcarbamoyl-AMP synthase [Chitinophagaceae bacterium]|nr:threonylcarbamoyl-AMP synthase [Chitinophagaceae bacterium]
MITSDISYAVNALNQGALVAIPTETVYGLAGSAFNEQAIQKIFQLKNRPTCNPLILHTHSINEVLKFVKEIPPTAMKLAEAFWPGPLTLLLPRKSNIPLSVTAGSHLVAVRIPNHRVTLDLLKQLDFPLVAPSANPYTRISPTNSKMVDEYFGDTLPCILEGDICAKGIESTIVGFHDNAPVIYRQGAISVDAIEFIAGKSKVLATVKERATTPGMSPMHYAPRTRFQIVDCISNFIIQNPILHIGVLTLGKTAIEQPNTTCIHLSIMRDLEEASANLYKSMYELDGMELDCIIIERFPEVGIGKSLNDRISRASYR